MSLWRSRFLLISPAIFSRNYRIGAMKLTSEQQQIIAHRRGHAKIIAVAGAGKTTTLGHFVKARLDEGQNPRRMLIIMYNKSAQLDFVAKFNRICSGQVQPQIRTFHSLGLKIYQRLIQEGVLPPIQGDLISQGESESVLLRLMQQFAPLDQKQDILEQKKKWLEPMVSFLDRAKATLEPASMVFDEMDLPSQCWFFPKVFDAFEGWRKQQGRISYNDMLYDPCMLFSRRPDVAARFANHMDWMLVDEYQDINDIQQFLLQTLAGQRSQVVVIGDPDQTIYEFRGSKPKFMQFEFDKQFSPFMLYTLSETFRYGHAVSLLANQLIQQNEQRTDVICLSNNGNPKTDVYRYVREDYGLQTLSILQKALKSYAPEDIVILNRLWGISAPIELALLEADIPYHLDHSSFVLERMELQPFIFLFSIAANAFAQKKQRSRFAEWLTFLTLPYLKIKRSTLHEVAQEMSSAENDFFGYFKSINFDGLTVWQLQQLENRMELVKLAEQNKILAHQLIHRHVRESDFYKGLSDSAFSRQQVDDRIATVQAFARFMARLNIKSDQAYFHLMGLKQRRVEQLENRKTQEAKKSGVQISSIHKAKGLEWPVVIIPGLTENYYPYLPESDFSTTSTEEGERRLLYVALTRAKNELHLIVPPSGENQSHNQNVSPYIEQMAVADLLNLNRVIYENQVQFNGNGHQLKATVSLPRRALTSAKRYVDLKSLPIVIKPMAIQKPKDQLPEPEKQIYSHGLKHARFGNGHLLKEDDRFLHIKFEDGKVRVFDKEIAASSIEWLV